MNIPRLLLAIVVAFVFIFVSDFLIHGLWLLPDYRATPSLWRPEAEQCANLPWMLAGQFLAAAVFSLLWAKGFAPLRCFKCACMFGLMMGLFNQSNTLISYAVWPLPPMIAVKWFGSALRKACCWESSRSSRTSRQSRARPVAAAIRAARRRE